MVRRTRKEQEELNERFRNKFQNLSRKGSRIAVQKRFDKVVQQEIDANKLPKRKIRRLKPRFRNPRFRNPRLVGSSRFTPKKRKFTPGGLFDV